MSSFVTNVLQGRGCPIVVGLSIQEGAVLEHDENPEPRLVARQHIFSIAKNVGLEMIALIGQNRNNVYADAEVGEADDEDALERQRFDDFDGASDDDDNELERHLVDDFEVADDPDNEGEGDEPVPDGEEEFQTMLRYGVFNVSSDRGKRELGLAFQSCEYLIEQSS